MTINSTNRIAKNNQKPLGSGTERTTTTNNKYKRTP